MSTQEIVLPEKGAEQRTQEIRRGLQKLTRRKLVLVGRSPGCNPLLDRSGCFIRRVDRIRAK